jgi:hypothetical protein
MHAPTWWYLWLGVVLLFGMISILRRQGGRPQHMPERRVLGRMADSDADWNGDLKLSGANEHAGRDEQATAAVLDEAGHAGTHAMALASHDPSFAPDAPVSPFDAGGPTHMNT